MQQILEMLKEGNARVVDFFISANDEWKTILEDLENIPVEELSKKLSTVQARFERICGDRYLGKVVMGWSGFTHLYSCNTGFEDNGPLAYKLAQAFAGSMCSLEVKHAAKEAAELYSVKDYA